MQVKKPVKRTWVQRWRQKQRLLRKAPHLHALVLHQVRANHHDIRCTRSPTHVRKMGCEGRKGEVVSFMAHRQSACAYMRAHKKKDKLIRAPRGIARAQWHHALR